MIGRGAGNEMCLTPLWIRNLPEKMKLLITEFSGQNVIFIECSLNLHTWTFW